MRHSNSRDLSTATVNLHTPELRSPHCQLIGSVVLHRQVAFEGHWLLPQAPGGPAEGAALQGWVGVSSTRDLVGVMRSHHILLAGDEIVRSLHC